MHAIYLFDFDYTLGDSTAAIVESVNSALSAMGYPSCAEEEIRHTVGMSLGETFTHLTQNGDPLLRAEFLKLFMERADAVMTAQTQLLPDSVPVLTYLKTKGFKIGIVTTKYHYRIDHILSKFEIAHLVDVIVGGDDVKNNKPHPEALLSAIKQLDAQPGDALYVGDSIIDAKTAQGAGVDFVAVTTGTTPEEAFSVYPKIAVITSLSELLDMSRANNCL